MLVLLDCGAGKQGGRGFCKSYKWREDIQRKGVEIIPLNSPRYANVYFAKAIAALEAKNYLICSSMRFMQMGRDIISIEFLGLGDRKIPASTPPEFERSEEEQQGVFTGVTLTHQFKGDELELNALMQAFLKWAESLPVN